MASVIDSAQLGQVHYVRQGEPLGLGHAVLCARAHVGDEPFAVLFGDDLIDVRDEILPVMNAVRQEHGAAFYASWRFHKSLCTCTAVLLLNPPRPMASSE